MNILKILLLRRLNVTSLNVGPAHVTLNIGTGHSDVCPYHVLLIEILLVGSLLLPLLAWLILSKVLLLIELLLHHLVWILLSSSKLVERLLLISERLLILHVLHLV